jgi:hypothetical protein
LPFPIVIHVVEFATWQNSSKKTGKMQLLFFIV